MFRPEDIELFTYGLGAIAIKTAGHYVNKLVGYPARKALGDAVGRAAETIAAGIIVYLLSDVLAPEVRTREALKKMAILALDFAVEEALIGAGLLQYEDYDMYEEEIEIKKKPEEVEVIQTLEEGKAYNTLQLQTF